MQEAMFYIVVLIVCYSVFVDKTVKFRNNTRKQKERTTAPNKTCRSIRRRRG